MTDAEFATLRIVQMDDTPLTHLRAIAKARKLRVSGGIAKLERDELVEMLERDIRGPEPEFAPPTPEELAKAGWTDAP